MSTTPLPDLKTLAVELQSLGVRTTGPDEGPGATRAGGAGPSDAGFIWLDGTPLTVPVHGDYVASSPYELVMKGSGRAGTLVRDGVEVGPVRLHPRPRIYDLETADGVPYWKIALMHLDSLASTVFQRCVYWGTGEQCHFCAIGTSLQNGRTVPVKTPAMLAEVAEAAARLDGAKDVTLTTGTPNRDDRGAPYMARCAEAIRDASGLPVQVQIEPPSDFAWFDTLKEGGVEALGLHLEAWDEEVLARVAPGKHAQGRDHYLAAWEAAVDVFGRGQVFDVLHPRARREPRVGHGGLPRRHRPRRLPVRGAAAAGARQHRGRRGAALRRLRRPGVRAGRPAARRGRPDEPGRARRLRALPGVLGAQHLRAGLRRRPRRRSGRGLR